MTVRNQLTVGYFTRALDSLFGVVRMSLAKFAYHLNTDSSVASKRAQTITLIGSSPKSAISWLHGH